MEIVYRAVPIVLGIAVFAVAGWAWFRRFGEGKYRASKRATRWSKLTAVLVVLPPLVVGGVSQALLGSLLLPATIHFDNGYDEQFEVLIDGKAEGPVAALGVRQLEASRGDHRIDIVRGGQLFESVEVSCRGNQAYIYNIGGKYTYYVITHVYSTSGRPHYGDGPELVGSETFFPMPQVNYGLGEEVPDSIEASRTSVQVTRTSLQRESR